MIRDRVIAGIERAKVRGRKSGKAIGRTRVGNQKEAAILAYIAPENVSKRGRPAKNPASRAKLKRTGWADPHSVFRPPRNHGIPQPA